ncbi:SusC/RagA family TonB-linked outer membrane protein [Luteirhabdus pelagi]|uniref:SusC/RagA family TonB-linked outer membrane protein n=1 Tax=Luteirhabdus pelagi TaxID=2792783 RepID=UPI001939BF8B|nr:SusC/RagA family TonB-linked outer membrane protein [Luteirhabdus pelagi]
MKTKFSGILTLLLALAVQLSFAQQKTITGTVTDDSGLPLPGANIIVKGTSTGTQSDFDGNYSITANTGQTLVYSYIGFTSQEFAVGADNTINVSLQPGSALEEVVVTAFGIRRSRNEITGNVVTVDSETIEKVPFVSAEQALQGQVSGLQINTTSGTPGSTQQIRIRGIQSVTASNEPLYVIDGVPVTNGNLSGSANVSSVSIFSLVAPSNIENITVLKDAVSTAPYGASGSNGVILITTKSGKQGRTQFNLTATTGFVNDAREGLIALSGSQKEELIRESIWQTFGSGVNGDGTLATRDDIDGFIAGQPTQYASLLNWIDNGRPNINWEDEVANDNAALQNVNFSVSKGSENSTFYASLGYNYTEATVIGSDFERVSGALKYGTDFGDKWNFNVSVNASNAKQNASLEQAAFFSNPNLSKYFLSPWINPYNADGTPNIGDDTFNAYTSLHNTLFTARKNIRRNDVTRALVNTDLSYELAENLILKTIFGIDYSLTYYKGYNSPLHGDGIDENGTVFESSLRLFNYTSQNQLDYSFTLGTKHNFRLTALTEYAKYKTYSLSGSGENFPNDFLTNLSAASANFQASSSFSDRTSTRLVGLFNYDFDQRYVFNASYSYQGDSRFSPETRFDSFYSAGLAWNIHREAFLADSNVISTLRLKGGYGITGNAGIGRNQFQALANFNAQYGDSPGAFIAGFGTNAEWEKGTKRDLAMDFGLFNGRINGTVGVYSNTTTDMLLDAPLGLSAQFIGDGGTGRALQNLGEMENKGLEIEINADIIRTDNFGWSLGGNFTTLENEVTSIPEDSEIITGTRVVEAGKKVYEWYLPVWAGVDPANGDPLFYTDETLTETTNVYAEAERVYQGYNALPTYSGGINTRVDLFNFFAEANVYFAGGNKIFEDWAGYTQSSLGSRILSFNATTEVLNGAWRQPGDIATHPRLDFNDPIVANAALASTRWLYDGDYVRLRGLALGYTFDGDQTKSMGIDGLTIAVRGTNLFTWVKEDDLKWDPEVEADGFTDLSTPPTKTITLNLNLKF